MMNHGNWRGVLLLTAILTALFSLLVPGCSDSTSSDENLGVRYFEFTSANNNTGDDNFIAATSDPAVIEKAETQLSLPRDQRTQHIHGKIERGDAGYNKKWSWHFVENKWDIVDISTEVCDGTPQMVEDSLDYWVDQVGTFCPWSSIVLQEVKVDDR